MKYFLSLLLSFLLLTTTPVRTEAVESMGMYVAIIASPDLNDYFRYYPKYQKDFYNVLSDWEQLDLALELIEDSSGNQPILLDFMVHGDPEGLYLQAVKHPEENYDRASMGFILNHVKKKLGHKNVTITFESCYAAAAYKNTIRGAKAFSAMDNIEDYRGVPKFPVWGLGDGFTSIGPMMYLQTKYRI